MGISLIILEKHTLSQMLRIVTGCYVSPPPIRNSLSCPSDLGHKYTYGVLLRMLRINYKLLFFKRFFVDIYNKKIKNNKKKYITYITSWSWPSPMRILALRINTLQIHNKYITNFGKEIHI